MRIRNRSSCDPEEHHGERVVAWLLLFAVAMLVALALGTLALIDL